MVNSCPFFVHMGYELTDFDYDRCQVALPVQRQHLQPFQIAHGGVFAALIDTATFWAAYMRIPQDAGMVNVDLKLNYLKAVSTGHLTATGKCLRPGRQVCYSEASIFDADGQLVAHGTSTLLVMPGKGLSVPHAKFIEAEAQRG
jgi:uncharacterized protein (TIGR00369 family)